MASYITIVLAVWVSCAVPTSAEELSANCTTAVENCFKMKPAGGPCGLFTSWLRCASATGNVCPLREPKVTFPKLTEVYADFCQELTPRMAKFNLQSGPCAEAVKQCLQQIPTGKILNQTLEDFSAVVREVISSDFWCRYGQENIKCFADNADVCSVGDEDRRVINEELRKIEDICHLTSAGCPSLMHSVSVLAVCVAVALFRG